MTPLEGRRLRHGRLRELMERRGLGAVVLRRPANFAWYTGGADSRVDHTSPFGVADILLTPTGEFVVTSSIEAPRMRLEQTPDLEIIEYVWYDGPERTLHRLAGSAVVGADVLLGDAVDVGDDVARLRRVLDQDAIDRLRIVGRHTTAALDEAADTIRPGMSEFEAAANIAGSCRRRALTAHVLLAAADDRIAAHRHPVPVGGIIRRRAMLVVSAERWGVYANLTRFVDLDDPEPEVARRQLACQEILRRMREEATLPGRTLADAFEDCRRFYHECGFVREERLHHQGGTTGYGSREVIATPSTVQAIEVGQAFAWNPSITGAKAEETFVLLPDGAEVMAPAKAGLSSPS